MKILTLLFCVVVASIAGCGAVNRAAPDSQVSNTVTAIIPVAIKQQEIVDGVIAIEIRRSDTNGVVYEEVFDQSTTVVRGVCPKQSFLPDWRVMPAKAECLVWSFDNITFAYGLQADLTVVYRLVGAVDEQVSN
jgi:hypothetical protein